MPIPGLFARRYPPPLPCIAPVSYLTEKLELSSQHLDFPRFAAGWHPCQSAYKETVRLSPVPELPLLAHALVQTPAVPRTLAISHSGLLPSAE
jgi:hypothetical protein